MKVIKILIAFFLMFVLVDASDVDPVEELGIPQEGRVVVNFWAGWCPSCVEVVEFLDENMEEDVVVIHVDVDEYYEFAQELGITNLPYVVFLEDGIIVDKLIGDVKFEMDLNDQIILEQLNRYKGE